MTRLIYLRPFLESMEKVIVFHKYIEGALR